ncbi:host attachment protein [Nioella nitratireducens]|uniref:host attachment protein n=1 Tax=Nioella nitratireducens TaxID=1287720 RepID=UPI0008FD0CC6|nr:host attachment protein [Nioella nitratireducens]
MKPERIWYVVLNSHRLRILRELPRPGDAAGPEITWHSPQRHLREALHDRPTRSFSSAGDGRRSGVEPGSDPVREDERMFLRQVFGLLGEERDRESYDSLVLFASPEIMGLWREMVPDRLNRLVTRDLVRNFVRLTTPDLVTAIRRALEAEDEDRSV